MAPPWCPCPTPWESPHGEDMLAWDAAHHRRLQADEADDDLAPAGALWEMIYVGVVLVLMFSLLLSDRVGADLVMLAALTACMAANIVTVAEGLGGFANEGVLTVLVLFVVASGIQLTGGLDWYMAKLLGRPANVAAGQLRLMVPIMVISAFLNNTPVVVLMIPICQKWGKNVGISPAQLLMPLSFASILGGTCTLIGTSTNLVVAGLLADAYPDDPEMQVGLFDLGVYGVPIAFIGMAYILLASPYLLPGGRGKKDTTPPADDGTILLGARLTKWSPAAGRTIRRSGLRDTGGVYLVSVHRARSGNIHRAVGQDFVLNVDDILYFTGMVQDFGQFCEHHGLEVVTNELVDVREPGDDELGSPRKAAGDEEEDPREGTPTGKSVTFASTAELVNPREGSQEGCEVEYGGVEVPPSTIVTKSARHCLSAEGEKIQAINRLTDIIRGFDSSLPEALDSAPGESRLIGPARIVVAVDTQDLEDVVIIGINAPDRPGLLLDISRGLHSLSLELHHTEATVILSRSLSIWRCASVGDGEVVPSPEEMQTVLGSLLENDTGVRAAKRRGLSVVRCVVTDQSRLSGKKLDDVEFRNNYKGAIVAVQKKDKNEANGSLDKICFSPGDILVLQVTDDSPLLQRPPPDFYTKSETSRFAPKQIFKGLKISTSNNDLKAKAREEISSSTNDTQTVDAWRDLFVLFDGKEDNIEREFLAALTVSAKSEHIGKTVAQANLNKQAGLFLVEVERQVTKRQTLSVSFVGTSAMAGLASLPDENGSEMASINHSNMPTASIPVDPEWPLKEGDVLWFAGSAAAMTDLRKIPGLVSVEDEELQQIDERVHDRRLVQAVVAKKGPLSGRTAKEVGFRTRYGAAVIAVHRDGTRVQDHPGKIKLHAGDVLLLEAGPTFISRNTDNQQSFALISEVKDSKPPRLDKLIPALVLVLTMLVTVAIGPQLFPEQNLSSLLVCGLVTSIIMVAGRILSQEECRDAVNWEVYVTIACAFGLGTAMTNSGLADVIANGLVSLGNALGIGDAGLYGAVYFATFLISNIVTNNAAAALMFPIAMNAANQTGANRLLMSYNLMLAASASFMSPFGYTTNLLVFGTGGYKVKDFIYIGTPMQVILWILTTVILSNTTTPWWVSWLWTFGVFVLVCLLLVFPAMIKSIFSKTKHPINRGEQQ